MILKKTEILVKIQSNFTYNHYTAYIYMCSNHGEISNQVFDIINVCLDCSKNQSIQDICNRIRLGNTFCFCYFFFRFKLSVLYINSRTMCTHCTHSSSECVVDTLLLLTSAELRACFPMKMYGVWCSKIIII